MTTAIEFGLGGADVERNVWLSHGLMERFGGEQAVREDFGGFLQQFSTFLDEHLVEARRLDRRPTTVALSKFEPDEAAQVQLRGAAPDFVVAFCLNVSPQTVRDWRDRFGVRVRGDHFRGERMVGRLSDAQIAEREAKRAEREVWREAKRAERARLIEEARSQRLVEAARKAADRAAKDWRNQPEVVALLRDATLTHKAVAAQLGVTHRTVQERRYELGVRGDRRLNPRRDWSPYEHLLRDMKLSNRQVAAIVGCDASTVGIRRGEMSLRSPHRGTPSTVDWGSPEVVALLRDETVSLAKIGRRLGVRASTVWTHRQRLLTDGGTMGATCESS